MEKKKYKTSDDLFREVNESLRAKGLLPEILDYGIPSGLGAPIRDICFNVIGIVDFGGSEGIYLDIYIDGDIGTGDTQRLRIGTYKTLEEDKEAFKTMSDLNVEFVFEAKNYVSEHRDELTRTGYKVHFYDGQTLRIGYISPDYGRALECVRKNFERMADRVTHALVINCDTGEEEKIEKK